MILELEERRLTIFPSNLSPVRSILMPDELEIYRRIMVKAVLPLALKISVYTTNSIKLITIGR